MSEMYAEEDELFEQETIEEQELEVEEIDSDDDAEMNSNELQSTVTLSIEDAVDFVDQTLSPRRAQAAEYYEGAPLGNEQEGRSTAQTMDVRDTIQAFLPSLMRIFCGSDQVVEYAPRMPEDVDAAKQATDYVNFILNSDQDQAYVTILYSAFKDALVKGAGFLKYVWRETESVETQELDNLDEQSLAAISADPSAEITSLKTIVGPEGLPLSSVTVTKRETTGRVKVESVPPEELLVNRSARDFSDADLVAHRRYITVSELVSMGYEFDEMVNFATNEDDFSFTNEEADQRSYQLDTNTNYGEDPSRQRVLYVEAYMRVDVDGDGISELRMICTVGSQYEIVRNEPADQIPFAMFCCDPEPHSFFGGSIADLTMDIQRIKSAVLRASLDSLAMSTHPRIAFVEGQASLEDLMNSEPGNIIRMRQPGAVVPFNLPYVGEQAFGMMAYLDEMRENRTGISKAASGLSPDQLQSSTQQAVNQTIEAAQQRTELIARLFSENGMTRLYSGILHLITKYQDETRIVRLTNNFVPMNPETWDPKMDVTTNVQLGSGGQRERMQMLQGINAIQEKLLTQFGPDNPIVSVQNMYNSLQAIMEAGGLKDAGTGKYFTSPADYQPPPQQPPAPDIQEQLIQVQMAEIQANIDKKQAELALEREKMIRDDDRLRDKNEADVILKAAELEARYGAQVNVAQIKANAERDREMVRSLAQQGPGQPNAQR
tara:strand:+ start:16 stop:2166 length:2151 start_codon:yes stop_codon:yes gene_type:complete